MEIFGVETERNVPEDMSVEPLLSVCLLESLLPISGSQLQDPVDRPAGQQAEKIPHVIVGVEFVHLTTRQQTHEVCIDMASFVCTQKQPIVSTDGFFSQTTFRGIVMKGQFAILQKTQQCGALIQSISKSQR